MEPLRHRKVEKTERCRYRSRGSKCPCRGLPSVDSIFTITAFLPKHRIGHISRARRPTCFFRVHQCTLAQRRTTDGTERSWRPVHAPSVYSIHDFLNYACLFGGLTAFHSRGIAVPIGPTVDMFTTDYTYQLYNNSKTPIYCMYSWLAQLPRNVGLGAWHVIVTRCVLINIQ